MSIKKELIKATKVKQGDADEQEFLSKLVKSISALSDDAWDKLSEEAQGWFNEAATAWNDEEDITGFEKPSVASRTVVKDDDVDDEQGQDCEEPEDDDDVQEEVEPEKEKKSKKDKKDKKDKKAKKAKRKKQEAAEELEDDAVASEDVPQFPKQRSAGNYVKLLLAQNSKLSLDEVTDIVDASEYEAKGNAVKYAWEEMSRLLKILESAGFSIVESE